MNKIDLLYGFIIGLITAFLGSYLFVTFFTEFDIITDFQKIKTYGYLGKIITLGTLLDLIVFTIFLKRNKELMARGVVLAVIVLAVSTLLI